MIVGVAGLGLIGSSVARGLLATHTVRGYDPDQTAREAAGQWGVEPVESAPDLAACDVVVLAAPTGANVDLLMTLMDGTPVPTVDLGSVKGPIVAVWQRHPSFPFVGTHPMAGSERAGCQASSPDLFRGSRWPVVVEPDTDPAALRLALDLIIELGAEAVPMSAARHDQAVAAVSHLPHLQAGALGNVVAADSDPALLALLAAGSFRDATRVSASPPDRTGEFVMANAAAAAAAARNAAAELVVAADTLERGDIGALTDWLQTAQVVAAETTAQDRQELAVSGDDGLRELALAERDSGLRILAVGPATITVVAGD